MICGPVLERLEVGIGVQNSNGGSVDDDVRKESWIKSVFSRMQWGGISCDRFSQFQMK